MKMNLKIGIETECNNFIDRHSLFFNRYSNLHKAMEIAFIREITGNLTSTDKAIFYLGRLCVEDFMEIMLLCGNGYGIAGMKILRGMYEKSVTAKYLESNLDKADDFWDFHWISKHKMVKAIESTYGQGTLKNEIINELEENYQTIKDRFQITNCKKCGTTRENYTWNKLDFVSMAYKTGTLSKLLVPAYYIPTEQIHCNPEAILSRLKQSYDGISFKEGSQRKEADNTFMFAHDILLNILGIQSEYFNLDKLEKQLEICFKDYIDIWNLNSSDKA